jgi:hypothetical protein
MITEDYVSFETAKLLKEKGFKHWCYKSYGDAVYHKGVPISFDEECELKSEGLEDEIEYVEGGCLYDFGCDNKKKETKVWAAPTLQRAMKWLREVHNQIVVPNVRINDAISGTIDCYIVGIWYIPKNNGGSFCYISPTPYNGYSSYEKACEAGIKYCLDFLI